MTFTRSILVLLALCYFLLTGGKATQITKRNGNAKFYSTNELEVLRRSKAADIKSWIDLSKDPCGDFYSYVCGNWARIYADEVVQQGWISRNTEIRSTMINKIEKYMTTLRAGSAVEGKIRAFYQSCLNVAADGCEYIEALKTVYEEYGKFSFMKPKGVGKSRGGFNWWQTAASIYQLYGYDFMIGVRVEQNGDEEIKIYLEEPSKQLHSKDENEIKDYLEKYIGASKENSEEVAREVLSFEKALLEAQADDNDDDTKPQYYLESLSKVHRKYRDLFDVETYLRTALNLYQIPTHIYVRNSRYLDNLLGLIENTKPDTVEDYILWRLTHKYLIDINPNTMQHLCSSLTTFYFSKYMHNRLYYEYRSSEFEKELIEMWENLKAVLLENLQGEKYQWMPSKTKKEAIEKLTNTVIKIISYDDENFEDFFKDLTLDPLNYILNIKALTKHNQELKRKMHSTKDLYLSASYDALLNEIHIPVSFMLPFNMWHSAYPKAILYATIGTSLAQEMFNIFDNFNSLWDANTEEEFDGRRLCFYTQYRNNSNDHHYELDLNEQFKNIADISSIELSNSAYLLWLDGVKQKTKIDRETFASMSYSNEELFFISYGQRWCQISNGNENEENGQFKLWRVLSNSDKFTEIFKCPVNAGMNPTQKCKMF